LTSRDQKIVYIAYNFESKEYWTSHTQLWSSAEQWPSVFSTDAKSCSHTFKEDGEVGTITDNTGHKLLSTENRKLFSQYDKWQEIYGKVVQKKHNKI
jgi:hypothetical protein